MIKLIIFFGFQQTYKKSCTPLYNLFQRERCEKAFNRQMALCFPLRLHVTAKEERKAESSRVAVKVGSLTLTTNTFFLEFAISRLFVFQVARD